MSDPPSGPDPEIPPKDAAFEREFRAMGEMRRIVTLQKILHSTANLDQPALELLQVGLADPAVRGVLTAMLEGTAEHIRSDMTLAEIKAELERETEEIHGHSERVKRFLALTRNFLTGQGTINPEQGAMADPTPTETELRIQLAEARTDKKFAEMLGEVRTGFAALGARLEAVERSTSGIRTTVITTAIGTGLGVLALVVAIMSYGQTWFGIGVTNRDTVRAIVTEMQAHPPAQPPPTAH